MSRKTALLLVFSISSLIQAQSPLGTITGVATDPSLSPIPGAALTLTNLDTGVARGGATNQSGVYVFPNLAPGNYKLLAEAKGFRTVETPALSLAAYRTLRQDLRFELQAAATEVTVLESASPVVQSETPSINTTLTTKQILELPTNLRSVYNNAGDSGLIFVMMPLAIPGVVQVGAGAAWLVPGSGANGVRLKVDGIETNFGNFGSPDPVSQPSFESVQEFTANILTNRAEFGGMGTITTVTRAGTNQYHGDLFWYARNSALDARNRFAPSRPFQNIHNYGASVGGPLKRDRTFFQFTFDGTRGSRAYLLTANVPTLAQRAGDFSGSAAVRNPFTNEAFAGNRIPESLISPQARRAQELLYPLPNFGPPTLTAGNYSASFNGPEVHRIVELRLDHNFSSAHSIFARYQFKKDDYKIPGARTQLPPSSVGTSTNIRRMNFWTLGDVYSLRPNIYNEFRAGVVILVSQSDADVKGQALLDQIGIIGLPPRPGVKGVPNIGVTGLTTISQTLLNPVNDGHAQLSDNLTWVAGKHSMKFGVEMVNWFVNRYLPTDTALFGNFSFTNRFTGHPYADFLVGLPTSVTRVDPYPTQYNRFRDWAFYAQDDFKITSNLTLSYGLRYEYNGAVKAEDGNMYSFDLATGSVVVPNEASRRLFSPYFPSNIPVITAERAGVPERLRETDKNNFAPRFGFSYQLGRNAKTVIRGGWGIYYGHFSGVVAAALATGPFSLSSTSTNAITNGRPAFTFESPFGVPGASGTLNLTGISPTLRNTYSMQYSLSIEREVVRDIGVRVSYIGSRGAQLPYQRNVNQPPASLIAFTPARRPYPLFNNINYAENGANNSYNGLQTQVQKRFSKGLLFTSAWTWAKQISEVDDTGSAELNTAIENTYDRGRERADVYAVPRHHWTNQVLYDLPLGSGHLLGGWQVNALVNLATGNYLTPVFSGADPSNTNTIGGRPDVVSGVDYPKTIAAWFDRAAFATPAQGRFGNAGRNIIRGPGYVIFNTGLAKNIRFERVNVQVGASFQNVLNHPNLGQPNMSISTVQGGTITSTHIFPPAGSARTGQLSLRLSF
jgi:hypothetical protein